MTWSGLLRTGGHARTLGGHTDNGLADRHGADSVLLQWVGMARAAVADPVVRGCSGSSGERPLPLMRAQGR